MIIERTLNLLIILIMLLFSMNHAASQEADTSANFNPSEMRNNRKVLQAENRNGILVLESSDQEYKFWFDARLQTDGAIFIGHTYNPIGNGVTIRRARFGIKSQFAKKWYGEIQMDIANSEFKLKDAYLKFSPNRHWGLQVGNFKEGFSLESTISSRYLTFIERANVISTFAPSRHLGLAVHYNKNWIFSMVGIHFQDISGPEERTFSTNNNKDHGVDEGISLTGRWVIMPSFNYRSGGLHLGIAGSYRTPKSDVAVHGTQRYSSHSLSSINRKKYMDTDIIPDVDHVGLGGFELAAYHKNFRFQSEYIITNVYKKNTLSKEQFNGWYTFGSLLLFGGNFNYSKSEAKFTQPDPGKKWGDIELAFRYDYLNLNSSGDGLIMGGAGQGYTFGINYLVNSNVKIMFNYAFLSHDRHANGNGELFVGYNEAGELTKDPKEIKDTGGKAGEDYSMITVRFEVNF